ncbi:GTPase Era [Psittacicella melopsittaci]|uniref:GTPase Era n=1 Tax=Psittacicella melopsittaci TaxID=2028576 RepID=A0A3A1XZV8_9GAMM|nr:GTPase Era [Psittacicella melopsittaci]RIY31582.1 GTPase Era [Psittacicella melopsittaci]
MTNTENKRCGYIGIVGRPNVGKSTLMNALLGQKIAITSSKPQTTRHRILGILTEDNAQLIFVDSPGIHLKETTQMNKVMNRTASSVLANVDVLYFVVEGTKWTDDDALVLSKLKQQKSPVILVLNKVDQIADKAKLLPYLQEMQEKYPWADMIPISAEKGDNLDALVKLTAKFLPLGEFHYDQDQVTDKGGRFMAAEFIREKLMRLLGDELPYATSVEIERFTMTPRGINVDAVILVDRDGQKRIIIGKNGEKIKRIGTEARIDLSKALERPINMNLWVKVKKGWSDDIRALRSLGYLDE